MLLSILFLGFSLPTLLGLLVVVGLLILSAAVSGSETAIFSLSPKEIENLRNERKNLDSPLSKIINKPKHLLATILIANNFINVALVILSTFIVHHLFDFSASPLWGFICEAVIITSLLLLFGEILPKVYASTNGLRVATFMAPVLQGLMRFFYPFAQLMVMSTSIIDKRLANKSHNISIEELSDVIDIATTREEDSGSTEKKFLKGIVKFGDIEVSEVMHSRLDVAAIEQGISFSEMMEKVLEYGYSRIPVYRETLDNVVGILHIKDLLPHLSAPSDFPWGQLLRSVLFVPENKKLDTLLTDFQEKKKHIAIVVDEYGGTSGIITLEDILEEILGDINDEFDSESDEKLYFQINANSWIFEGKISLNDFCKIVRIDGDFFDDMRSESESLAGLILERTGEIPLKGAEIQIAPFTFRIEAVDMRRIKKIRVSR